jgi:tripartite-type tricarboxylate transporter receptor subunit TctC
VTTVALVPNVLVVNANLPVKNVNELVALAKKTPGKLTFGSNGNGTGQHLIGIQFGLASGVDIMHVPYKGSGPLTIDLLGGQIDMSFDTVTPVLSHIRAGKLRALAVTTIKRSDALPDVPTLDEAGLKGFDQGTWFGVLAPAATPKDVVTRLNAEIVKIVNSPDFRKRMDEIGAIPIGNSAAQMAAQVKTDTERYAKLVKDAKVTVE